MDCPRPINVSILPHLVVANQALQENTKVRGPGVEAKLGLQAQVQSASQSAKCLVYNGEPCNVTEGGGGGGDVPSPKVRSPPKKILQIN